MAKNADRPAASGAVRANEVRIIGGRWKRTRLAVADQPGLRPTPDRVRETLFNWLASLAGGAGGELAGWRCLDAFAGTGALGFEAASRGAAEAVRIERGNGVAALERAPAGSLSAVFIDPPFGAAALYSPALAAAARALKGGGVVYLEAPRRWAEADLAPFGLAEFRYLRAGAVHAHLLKLNTL